MKSASFSHPSHHLGARPCSPHEPAGRANARPVGDMRDLRYCALRAYFLFNADRNTPLGGPAAEGAVLARRLFN
jgi:hypothetical protein